MRLRSRSARTASAGACTRPPARSSPAPATRTRRPRRSRARRACRRRRSTSTSTTRRTASSRSTTPPPRRSWRRCGGPGTTTAAPTRPAACVPSSTRCWRCWRRSPTRPRRCWSRSSAPARGRWSGATGCWPSTRPTSTRSTARTRSAAAPRGSPRRTTRSRSSGRWRSSPRARSAPVSPTTSATSSRSSSASCSGCCGRRPRRRRERPRAGRRPPSLARRARGRGARVPPLPAAGRMARARSAGEARGVPRRGLLGPPDRRLRRPGCERDPAGARAGRARREPHGARVHRRSLRGLPVRRAAQDRLREPGRLAPPRRRARAARLLDHGVGALRPAGQQAAALRARQLRPLAAGRAAAARARPRDRLPRRVRVGVRAAPTRARPAPAPALRPRGRGAARRPHAARLLSPQPAEHLHRGVDAGDARRGARARARDLSPSWGASVEGMSGRARYAAILRMPHVAPLLVASMLARLPFGIHALALVLYLAQERDSFAVAGLVDGAFGIGAAIGSPLQSRLIDRLGQRRVLLPLAFGEAVATAGLVALTESGAPTAGLAACGLLGGFAIPNIGAALRTLWPELLRRREELVPAAFALDSVAIELLFTVGPLIAAAVIAVVSPIAALGLSAACTVTGVALFVMQPPSRDWLPHAEAGSRGALGALRSDGVRTLMLATLPVGFCFGAVEISLPAFAKHHGAPAWAGVLLSIWALASAVGGLTYGARNWRVPIDVVYLRLAALILPAGLLIAPLGAAGNQLVGQVAPAGAVTEAYTWPVTALIAGFAVGTAAGGALVEGVDWRACFAAAALAGVLGALIAFSRRRTLLPRPGVRAAPLEAPPALDTVDR